MSDILKVNLFDSLAPENYYEFWDKHNFSSEFEPSLIEWVRKGPGLGLEEFDGVTVFTDKDLVSPWVDRIKTKYKIAWIVECRDIHPFAYRQIKMVENKFDYIFTFDEELLKRGDKYVKNLIGTSRVSDQDAGIFEKNKLISLIASDKKWTRGHQLRHKIAEKLSKPFDIDLWGTGYKPFGKKKTGLSAAAIREGKEEPLKDYYFSVTVMNSKANNYFTETLVDVFRYGTIPIFWGCDNIGEFFNEKGILKFNTGPELLQILKNATPELYEQKRQFIEENYELAKKYCSMDDTFARNLMNRVLNEKQ
tara:strand:+ start:14099 stop:15019 length:921 start_codon:yes stop_codon:yes gene_type:complete